MGTTAATRVYCSNDAYIRYKTISNFRTDLVSGLYWANIKVSTTSNSATNPTFAIATAGQFIANNGAGPHFTGTSTTGNWAYLRLNNGSTYWDIATKSNSGSGGLWLARLNGTDNGIFVSTGNNVGISIASPSYKLHVAGDIYTTIGFKKEGSSDSYVLLGGGGHKAESLLSVANADTIDGYHANSFVRESSASYNKSDGVAGWMRIAEQSPGTNVEYSIANSWYHNECNTLTFIVSYNYYNSTTPQITVLSSGTSLYSNIRIIGTDAKVGYVEVYINSSSVNNTYYLNARRLNIYGWCALYTTYKAGSGTATREIGSLNNSIGFASSGNINAAHFYENSDIRYKDILNNLTITINNIATLPIFNFRWKEDNSICTGTSAQAVQEILPNIVSGTDRLTLDYGVLGTIAGITACKELVTYKSEL